MDGLINNGYSADVFGFNEDGFTKVKQLFDNKFIDHLRNICNREKHGSSFKGFKKNRYNVGITDPVIKEMLESEAFSTFMIQMTNRPMVFTDGIIFEIDSSTGGFDWHIGITSFKYIYPEDFACTIWIPLDPLDPLDQDGAMSLVSTKKFSGREFYKLQQAATASINDRAYRLDRPYTSMLGINRYSGVTQKAKMLGKQLAKRLAPTSYSESLYFSQFSKNLLENECLSHSYDLGDCMIFDKYVFHRSNRLRPGKLPSRRAFVLRFIDAQSRFNEVNAKLMGGENSQIVDALNRGHQQNFDLTAAVLVGGGRDGPTVPARALA